MEYNLYSTVKIEILNTYASNSKFTVITFLGILSGMYEDDFESSLTQEQISLLEEGGKEGAQTGPGRSSGSDTSDIEIERGEEGEAGGSVSGDSVEGDSGGEGIEVDFADISALRESLEADSIIRKSIVSYTCR